MFLNIIATILCAIAAIVQGVKGNLMWCVIEVLLAALNLPYAIEWLRDLKYIHNTK